MYIHQVLQECTHSQEGVIALTNETLCCLARVTYKQQYERFKMVNVVVMFCLSAVALFSDSRCVGELPGGADIITVSDCSLPNALVHFMSVWYYFTVILRELILVRNGSRSVLTHNSLHAVMFIPSQNQGLVVGPSLL